MYDVVPATTRLRCTCGSRDINIIETSEWTSVFEARDGRLDLNSATHNPSCILRTEAICVKCKRGWRPRGHDRRAALQIDDVTIPDDGG